MWTDVRRLRPMFVGLVVLASMATALWSVDSWLTGRLPWQQNTWGFQVGQVRGNELAIAFSYGACDHYAGVQVHEADAQVTIRVRGHQSQGNCVASAVEVCRRIVLREPLGDRVLSDGRGVVTGRGPIPGPPASYLSACTLENAR